MVSNLERPEVSGSSVNPDTSNTSDPDASNPDRAARQDFSKRHIQSGKASPSFSANNTGDNVNVCPTGLQAVTTPVKPPTSKVSPGTAWRLMI